jgi:hypothetical protein
MTTIKYNAFQFIALLSRKKKNMWECGRGIGKSTAFARTMYDLVTMMPRGKFGLVGETFKGILDITLPATIAGLEAHGLIKDYHFVIGRPHPSGNEAFQPPLAYKNAITFWNGSTVMMVSQDHSATSNRGMNFDAIIGDEAARLDRKKLGDDVLAANRGTHKGEFGKCPLWCSEHFATSTALIQEGEWIYGYEDLAKKNPDECLFIRMPTHVNIANLSPGYIESLQMTMFDWQYNAEVLCIRPGSKTGSFYPLLGKQHEYYAHDYEFIIEDLGWEKSKIADCRADKDLNRDAPLIIGLDFGANINCMVTAQLHHGNELRFLKNHYVLSPKIIDDVVQEWCDYYQHHRKKNELFVWYDAAGNVSQANSKLTHAQQAAAVLARNGWRSQLMTRKSNNPQHELKYILWNLLLREDPAQRVPRIRFNATNCRELLGSMQNAPAKKGSTDNAIKKDKSSERQKRLAQERATHLSDAADTIVYGMFNSHLRKASGEIPPAM